MANKSERDKAFDIGTGCKSGRGWGAATRAVHHHHRCEARTSRKYPPSLVFPAPRSYLLFYVSTRGPQRRSCTQLVVVVVAQLLTIGQQGVLQLAPMQLSIVESRSWNTDGRAPSFESSWQGEALRSPPAMMHFEAGAYLPKALCQAILVLVKRDVQLLLCHTVLFSEFCWPPHLPML